MPQQAAASLSGSKLPHSCVSAPRQNPRENCIDGIEFSLDPLNRLRERVEILFHAIELGRGVNNGNGSYGNGRLGNGRLGEGNIGAGRVGLSARTDELLFLRERLLLGEEERLRAELERRRLRRRLWLRPRLRGRVKAFEH